MAHGSGFKLGKARRLSDEFAEFFQIFKIVVPAGSRKRTQHCRREFPRSRRFRNDGGNASAIAEFAQNFPADRRVRIRKIKFELSPINFLHSARVVNISNGWIILAEAIVLFFVTFGITIWRGNSDDVF